MSLVFDANLSDLDNITQNALQHSLCMFIPEVTELRGGSPYPGKTLYEIDKLCPLTVNY